MLSWCCGMVESLVTHFSVEQYITWRIDIIFNTRLDSMRNMQCYYYGVYGTVLFWLIGTANEIYHPLTAPTNLNFTMLSPVSTVPIKVKANL